MFYYILYSKDFICVTKYNYHIENQRILYHTRGKNLQILDQQYSLQNYKVLNRRIFR